VGIWFDTISGHGSAEIDTGTSQFAYGWEVQGLDAVTPRVRQLSTEEPLEWQYAGSVGMAAITGTELTVKFFRQVRFTHESGDVGASAVYVTHTFWKLPPGVELLYSVYW
jgi:hypothetical protein